MMWSEVVYEEFVGRLQNDEMAAVYASYSLRLKGEAIKESVVRESTETR